MGWTRGTVPRRSTAGPRALRIFLMDEIFSSSNLLIRLKPAGQSGAHEGHGPGTGGSPQSPSWGVRGSLRGSFLTRDILILVPSQVLVPELRAQLPCEAKQHIAVTAVSPGAVGRAGWDHTELSKPRRVSGCCQQLAPTPPRQHRPNKPRSSTAGTELALPPPTGEMFSPALACFASGQPRGWNQHQEARPGARDTHSAIGSCPFLSHLGDSSELVALGTGVRVQPEAEAQEMPRQARSRGRCCLQG